MVKYKRGPMIEDIMTLIFCMEHGDFLYHGTHCFPPGQWRDKSIRQLKDYIKKGLVFMAEVS